MREKKFFFVFFSEFFRFLSENFSDFWPENFKKMWKLPSACPQEQLVALYLFKKFWTVLDFLRKPLAWFSKFYLRVQRKNCGKNSLFLFSFQNFFRILSEIFSDFWPKNFRKYSKLPYTCPEDQFVAWNFFLKFWIVLDFLQKPSAWFSKFYLRVQSKNFGRNSFLNFLFRIFSYFERKFFQTFGQKTSKSCQIYLLRVQRNSLWLEILRHGSQNSIYVSRVKLSEETVFLFFFSDFFLEFERKFFRTFGEKSSKSCQNYLLRVQRNNLWLEIFLKVLNRFWILCRNLWHGSQISIYVSRVKIAEETVFLFFVFRFFSDFERKFFQTFCEKSSKSCQNYLLRVQRNSL